jgi:transcriptional pleiotropic regulator of transition state genes
MKVATGDVRKIDRIGRLGLPRKVMRKVHINILDTLAIYMDGENVVLKKYVETCKICGSSKDLIEFKNINICSKCKTELKKFIKYKEK